MGSKRKSRYGSGLESPSETLIRIGEVLRATGIIRGEVEDELKKTQLRRGRIDLPGPDDPVQQALAQLKEFERGIVATSAATLDLIRLAWQLEDVIEDRDAAVRWLKKSCRALNGRRPLGLLHRADGLAEVRAVLGRLDHGVYG